MTYRRLSPRDQAALDATRAVAGVYGRDDRVAVVVRGKHRERFLHALLTAAFNGRTPRSCFDATLTDAQGRLLADVRALVGDDDVTLFVARRRAEAFVAKLLAHRVAERVSLDIDEELALVEVVGPRAGALVAAIAEPDAADGDAPALAVASDVAVALRLGGADARAWAIKTGGGPGSPGGDALDGVAIALPRAALGAVVPGLLAGGASIGCHAAADALALLAGRPDLDADVPDGTTPWELGLGDAVALDKGCYLGQEALAMQAWRGQLRRHLCWVRPVGDALPGAGALLRDEGGRRAGFAGRGVVFADGSAVGLATVGRKQAVAGTRLGVDGADSALDVIDTTRPGVWST